MTIDPTAGETARAASALCKACGLCCTGALFSHVSVSPIEIAPLREAGLDIQSHGSNDSRFLQPCTCYGGQSCTRYDVRPAHCRDYYCHIQRDVLNGTMAEAEAHAVVADLKRSTTWFRAKAAAFKKQDSRTVNLRDLLVAHLKAMEQIALRRAFSAKERESLLNAFEYVKQVDRYFLKTPLLTRYARLVQTAEEGARFSRPQKASLKVSRKGGGAPGHS